MRLSAIVMMRSCCRRSVRFIHRATAALQVGVVVDCHVLPLEGTALSRRQAGSRARNLEHGLLALASLSQLKYAARLVGGCGDAGLPIARSLCRPGTNLTYRA